MARSKPTASVGKSRQARSDRDSSDSQKPSPRSRLKAKIESKPLDNILAFFGQMLKENRQTGAVLPSSPVLAKAMTRSLRKAKGPKRLLEVGPGTGPFTKYMLKALEPGDELHVVEINPIFAARLEEKLLAPFRQENPSVKVELYCQPIETAGVTGTFDFIVCGLPFNNFPPMVVRSIFRRLLELLREGGELAYFEYAGVRIMKGPLVGAEGRRKLKKIHSMAKVLRRRHKGKRQLVLGNMPPAVAVRLTR